MPALNLRDVIWIFFKRILEYLNAGKGKILPAFMRKRAGKHAGHAALTFFCVNQQIALARRESSVRFCEKTASADTDRHNTRPL